MTECIEQGFQSAPLSAGATSSRLGLASLCVYALEFFEAAKREMPLNKGSFSPARLFLACHALELALRAYLTLRGQNTDAVSATAVRHDLQALFARAEACGVGELAQLTPQHRAQIGRCARYYSQAVFEYPALAETLRGHPDAPDFETLLSAVASLVPAVCTASAAAI